MRSYQQRLAPLRIDTEFAFNRILLAADWAYIYIIYNNYIIAYTWAESCTPGLITMKYNLLSLIAGTEICNARCPFCISRMTPKRSIEKRVSEVDWRNFHRAAKLAREGGAQTVMITGKGEPTLYPEQISSYLEALPEHGFTFVELQTNGTLFDLKRAEYEAPLRRWVEQGLTTVIISVVHSEPEANRAVYLPHRSSYIDLPRTISLLHSLGLTVRINLTMLKGYVDSAEKLARFIAWATAHGVDQVSCRPVVTPDASEDLEAFRWTQGHLLSKEALAQIREYLLARGTLLQRLPHGAAVFDLQGQNVCLTNCLTVNPEEDLIRQLIFFPSGTIAYDWQHKGAILLRGKYDQSPASKVAQAA